MRENYRNSIASVNKFPQFTTMNVIDGQAGLIICVSLIFYSLTIDNILNIIVLLILAGISISMLSGDNGILQKATDAKTETEKSHEKEIVALAYNSALTKKVGNSDSTPVTAEDLNTELTNQGASSDGSNPITVTFTDSKRQYTINSNGIIDYAGISNGEENPTELTVNLTISGESVDTVPIPDGFYHVGGTKDTGFIISDNQADENKGTSHEVAQTLVGNQFVWVPVDKNQKLKLEVKGPEEITSIKLKDPFGDEINLGTVSGTTYTNATLEPTVNGLYYVEATAGSETKTATLVVRSLYAQDTFNDFFSTEDGIKALMKLTNSATKAGLIQKIKGWGWITSEHPTDMEIGWANAAASKGYVKTNDYKDSSVNEKGGFYVGRYEAGNASGTLVSKANTDSYMDVTRSQASDLADGMYTGKSHLLTGAAWDRTLGWLINKNNKTIVQVAGDSRGWGNYSDDEFSNTTGRVNTGIFSQTNAMGIYDLAGNVCEWTSEIGPNSSYPFVLRGGSYNHTGSLQPTFIRAVSEESYTHVSYGFRVALFL